jgi:aryl-alcohol dehydrogenase-like predicted oxidoreductase
VGGDPVRVAHGADDYRNAGVPPLASPGMARIATTDLDVFPLCLGGNVLGWTAGEAQSFAVLDAYTGSGGNFVDTADSYSFWVPGHTGGESEAIIGRWMASRGKRDDMVIATKVGMSPGLEGLAAKTVRDAAEASLERLGTDRIDLYYQHFPDPDPGAPAGEALEALDGLVRAGKVLHIANSNLSGAQISEAESVAEDRGWARFTGTQIEWSLLSRAVEDEVVPAATAAGLGVVPYFPLASGMLTGKYRRGEPFPPGTRLAASDYFASVATDEAFAKVEAYRAFATERGHTVAELAVAWLLAQPSVASVITGATKPEQIATNSSAAAWALTPDEAATVAAL